MKENLFKLGGILLVTILIGLMTYKLIGTDRGSVGIDITKQIQSIKAPSGALGAGLMIDGIETDVNSWHAPTNPQYPVPVDVQFRQAVLLGKIGFQSQSGAGNAPRAPREVRIYGGPDFEHLEVLTTLTLEFPATGTWIYQNLPKTQKKFRCYRLSILSNHGSPDYLTVQELKFFGKN